MKRTTLIFFALLLLLTGCRETPKEPLIVNKNQE